MIPRIAPTKNIGFGLVLSTKVETWRRAAADCLNVLLPIAFAYGTVLIVNRSMRAFWVCESFPYSLICTKNTIGTLFEWIDSCTFT